MIPLKVTYGEKYGPAMEVKTKAEAEAYFNECVAHTMRVDPAIPIEEAQRIERLNIGYWSGYCSRDVMARVEELYGFGHPFIRLTDTPEDVLRKGMELGKAKKK